MTIEAMKQALTTLGNLQRDLTKPLDGYHEHSGHAIAALRAAIAKAEKQEPVAWPCHIIEADFVERTITLGMECGDFKVSAGQHWLHTTPPAAQRQPLGYAGVTMWVGDKTVTQLVTEAAITHERVPGMNMTHTANKCFSLLGAPQRQWVGLTDEEAMQIWEGIIKYAPGEVRLKDFARAIEAKLKEKNA